MFACHWPSGARSPSPPSNSLSINLPSSIGCWQGSESSGLEQTPLTLFGLEPFPGGRRLRPAIGRRPQATVAEFDFQWSAGRHACGRRDRMAGSVAHESEAAPQHPLVGKALQEETEALEPLARPGEKLAEAGSIEPGKRQPLDFVLLQSGHGGSQALAGVSERQALGFDLLAGRAQGCEEAREHLAPALEITEARVHQALDPTVQALGLLRDQLR